MTKYLRKFISIVVVCAFAFTNVSISVEPSYGSASCLAPTSYFKPLVTINEEDGLFSIQDTQLGDSKAEITGLSSVDESFKDDVAIIYLSQLVARAIELRLGPEGLKTLVKEHFIKTGLDLREFFGRFRIEEAYERDGIFCVPYERKDNGAIQLLKYYAAASDTEMSPDKALIVLDGITVVLEDPEPDSYYTAFTNINNNISEYGKIGLIDPSQPSVGIKRLGFSPEETEAHFKLIRDMVALGFDVSIDEFGNTYIRYHGGVTDPATKVIRMMSHLDTVPAGGKYDGAAGIMVGIEILRALKADEVKLTNPVELVVYRCEESSRFKTALFGSGLVVRENIVYDQRSLEERKAIDGERERIKDQARKILGIELPLREVKTDLSNILEAFEIHVEQGNILFNERKDVALVTGIAAPVRYEVPIPAGKVTDDKKPKEEDLVYLRFLGQKDHSGATPMLVRGDRKKSARRDALCALAELNSILFEKLRRDDLVYGFLIDEGSINTIPGDVLAAIKIHPDEMPVLEEAISIIRDSENRKKISIKREHYETAKKEFERRSEPKPGDRGCPRAYKSVLDTVLLLERQAIMMCGQVFSRIESGDMSCSESSLPVGTIGEVIYKPGGNSDDGAIIINVDIRGYDEKVRDDLVSIFKRDAELILKVHADLADKSGRWGWPLKPKYKKAPTKTNDELRTRLVEVARSLDLSFMQFHSGAGHDLMNFAREGIKIGLIFVPSVEGVSHNPDELTETGSLAKAWLLLYEYLKRNFGHGPGNGEPVEDPDEKLVLDSGEKAREFTDEIKLRAQAAKETGTKIIIGIDSEWIGKAGDTQLSSAQGLVNSLTNDLPRLLSQLGLDNVIVLREKGEELAVQVKSAADRENVAYSNVIILGDSTHVTEGMFDELTDKDPNRSAFLVGVDSGSIKMRSQGAESHYLRILEMLTVALKSYKFPERTESFANSSLGIQKIGPKKFLFIPKAEPVDLGILKKIYECQRQAVIAA